MLSKRMALAVFAFAMMISPSSAQGRPDLLGVWGGHAAPGGRTLEPNYFRAELRQAEPGVFTGAGVVNLCAGCRGFGEYDVSWSGRWTEDGGLELTGTPTSVQGRWRSVVFSGRATDAGAVEGMLTRTSDGRAEVFVMERLAPDAVADGAAQYIASATMGFLLTIGAPRTSRLRVACLTPSRQRHHR